MMVFSPGSSTDRLPLSLPLPLAPSRSAPITSTQARSSIFPFGSATILWICIYARWNAKQNQDAFAFIPLLTEDCTKTCTFQRSSPSDLKISKYHITQFMNQPLFFSFFLAPLASKRPLIIVPRHGNEMKRKAAWSDGPWLILSVIFLFHHIECEHSIA